MPNQSEMADDYVPGGCTPIRVKYRKKLPRQFVHKKDYFGLGFFYLKMEFYEITPSCIARRAPDVAI